MIVSVEPITPHFVRNDLLLHIDAANPRSYPGSGLTWRDLSGNGNDLTFSGTPTITNGVFNSGNSVYAYRNYIPLDSAINGYTFDVAFKINSSTGTDYQNICQNGNGATNVRHMVWFNGSFMYPMAIFHVPYTFNNTFDVLTTGSWYHWQLSYNPAGGGTDGKRMWINGIETTVYNSAYANVNVNDGYFTVSSDSALGTYKSDISYAFVRYYNRFLSDNEISKNFGATRKRFGL